MSGRLILLPHKKWNVWNREAIAKVRNDERDHAEAIEAAAANQRDTDAEARLETLRKRAHHAQEGSSSAPTLAPSVPDSSMESAVAAAVAPAAGEVVSNEGATSLYSASGHINLFSDAEHALGANEDAERERRAKEDLEARKGRVNPLGLGGTREERARDVPWWTTYAKGALPAVTSSQLAPVTSMGSSSSSSSGAALANHSTIRERIQNGSTAANDRRKVAQDPMGQLVVTSSDGAVAATSSSISSSTWLVSSSLENDRTKRKTHTREKKHSKKGKKARKKDSKAKKKKRSRSESDDDTSSSESTDSRDADSRKSRKATHGVVQGVLSMAELRARRLEREQSERVRAADTVARHAPADEAAGFVAELTRRKYNSAYFPAKDTADTTASQQVRPSPGGRIGNQSGACFDFQKGRCTRGDACRFEHR